MLLMQWEKYVVCASATLTDEQDKYVRSVADFLNLQERTKRDMDNARNFAIRKFAVDLLESIDNFDRALLAVPEEKLSGAAAEENKELQELVTGLRMTQHILMTSLKKHGVERFDPSDRTEDGKTQKFDPNMHEATFMAKSEGMNDGDVMYTQAKGFTLNGVVLRVSLFSIMVDLCRALLTLPLTSRLPRLALSRMPKKVLFFFTTKLDDHSTQFTRLFPHISSLTFRLIVLYNNAVMTIYCGHEPLGIH